MIHAQRADHDTTTLVEQRLEQVSADALRIQTWAIADSARTPLTNTIHRAAPR